jgi:hypothetical protein
MPPRKKGVKFQNQVTRRGKKIMSTPSKRLKYRFNLNEALERKGPFDGDSMLELVTAVAPHVSSPAAFRDRIMAVGQDRPLLVAVPPTLYKDSYIVLSLSRDGIKLVRAEWTPRSFDGGGTDYIPCETAEVPADLYRHGRPVLVTANPNPSYSFLGQAFSFARKKWGAELKPVTSSSLVNIRIMEPNSGQGFKVLFSFTAALTTPAMKLLETGDVPPFDAFDEGLETLADDPVAKAELAGDQAFRVTYFDYCICGGPAGRGCGCFAVGPKFAKQSPAPMRMSAHVVDFARKHGHTFKNDPIAALAVERAAWRSGKC